MTSNIAALRTVTEPKYVRPLTPAMKKYCEARGQGLGPPQAAHQAGFTSQMAHRCEKDPRILAEIGRWRQKTAEENKITRKTVIDGFREAIEHAKLIGEPASEIAGWREIAKVCGLYEPIKHQLDITMSGKLTLQAIQTMSDAELLALSEGKSAEAIEGVFKDVSDVPEAVPDPKTDG